MQWKWHRMRKPVPDTVSQLTSEGTVGNSGDGKEARTTSQLLLPPSEPRNRTRSRSRDRQYEPQGLNVLYEPPAPRAADIIFVHGLGGSSISTWTKDGDASTFWPQTFLPTEPGFSRARIMSFGYMAFFLSMTTSRKLSITDFARSLLASLQNEPELGLGQVHMQTVHSARVAHWGQVPIIFVAHSLGGLVVKKVCTLF